jgi:hypothetical protein
VRPAQEIMGDLASAGLTAEQLALVIELSAAVATEARPAVDRAAENKRAYDREYRKAERRKSRTTSHDNTTINGSPHKVNNLPPSKPPSVISNEITPPTDKPTLVLEAFNLMADEAGLPKARMTPERRKKLASFTRRHKVEDITEAIWRIPQTPFLCGENERGWKADFDFLLQPKSFNRILEGSYGG